MAALAGHRHLAAWRRESRYLQQRRGWSRLCSYEFPPTMVRDAMSADLQMAIVTLGSVASILCGKRKDTSVTIERLDRDVSTHSLNC